MEDYIAFLAEVRKSTNLDMLVPDNTGLVTVSVDDRYTVSLQYLERTGEVLCFVEVKTRAAASFGRPAEAVDIRKQQRILKTANVYLAQHPCDLQPRFDVAEVVLDNGKCLELNYIENAFGE